MSKVAIITDSNSGITQEQAKELGVFVLATPFMIDEETYLEGVSLSIEDFYNKMEADADISTSQPSPDSVMKIWEEALKEYDEAVYIPLSSGLSGSCQTAYMLSQDYDGKIEVVDNHRISVTLKQSVFDAKRLADQGLSAKQIKDALEEDKYNSSIYIMLDTLKYLKKGGRITPAAAAIGTLLRLKPVLQIQGDKLDSFAKARTVGQAKTMMINAIKADIENRFGGDIPNGYHLHIAHTKNEEAAKVFAEEVAKEIPGYSIQIDPLSLVVSCHIGPGSLALAVTKDMK